ncbi:F-box/LRR-repeat protein At3g26922-like [Coffea eugenioides]|uniref:F-box/LRR-repeat protein At3g26922-like n=1 Tax=Coffea eugenioides TaxID=49369 RepID=UPI000F60B303|nr:F-box/LRR-repeat protein At3g26922-like [Coffea eugenioides]
MAEQPVAKRPATQPTTIDDLPENLLIRILSLLPLISAIQTSFISRKWRNLWHSLPSLKFKITKFPRNPASPLSLIVQQFSDFVSQTLINRPNTLPLRKFSLLFLYSSNHRYRSLVTTWLRYALDCSVKELNFRFAVYPKRRENNDGSENSPYYDFHLSDLMNNTSVIRLMLCRCEIIMPSRNLVRFESLRSLELVEVDLSDELLSDLILRCENLKKLVLRQFHGLRKFRIVSEKLQDLELSRYYVENAEDFDSSVEICTPNLSRIEIRYFYVANYKGDLSSVVEAELRLLERETEGYIFQCWSKPMSLLTGVQRLTVQNNLLLFIHSEMKPDESFQFKNLKHLELKTGYTHSEMVGLAALLMQAPVLETLVLDYVYQTEKEASFCDDFKARPFTFDIPTLQEVKMTNFRNTDLEYHVLALLGREKVVLNKVVLVPAKPERSSLSGPMVFDLTAYEDWTSAIAALLRHRLVPQK